MRESLILMFDFIQCRCEPEYKLDVIYGASCLLNEFGINRETKRFMEILTATDPVHEESSLKIIALVVLILSCPQNIHT